MPTATAPSSGSETLHSDRARRSKGTAAKRSTAHLPTDGLLDTYWAFVPNKLASACIVLVGVVGAGAVDFVTGDMKAPTIEAVGLQKARGRNIEVETVEADLGIKVPDGFTPTFDLYLQALGIKPDLEYRGAVKMIVTAIKQKIRMVRKPPDEAAG